jgi:hypothetical protein
MGEMKNAHTVFAGKPEGENWSQYIKVKIHFNIILTFMHTTAMYSLSPSGFPAKTVCIKKKDSGGSVLLLR